MLGKLLQEVMLEMPTNMDRLYTRIMQKQSNGLNSLQMKTMHMRNVNLGLRTGTELEFFLMTPSRLNGSSKRLIRTML